MKNFLLLLLTSYIFTGCSLDDDAKNVIYERIPVESVVVPVEFEHGLEYSITMSYRLPSDCHSFYGIEYQMEGNTAYFGLLTSIIEGESECVETASELEEASFLFTASQEEKYIFKFWQGEDTEGKAIYLTREIPVVPHIDNEM